MLPLEGDEKGPSAGGALDSRLNVQHVTLAVPRLRLRLASSSTPRVLPSGAASQLDPSIAAAGFLRRRLVSDNATPPRRLPHDAVVSGQPRDAAIFVGGMPRSGTSLMRDILGSHPDVAMFFGELPLWRELASAHAGRSLARAADRDALIRDLVTHPRMQRARMALDGDELAAALAGSPR